MYVLSLLSLICLFISLYGAVQTSCQSPANSLPGNVADKIARERTVAFINVNVLPMDQETTLKNQTVVVQDGKIAFIGAADQIEIPDNAFKVDGRNQFLMPGLADMHVHIRDEKELISYLSYGVTTVLNMRGTPEILRLRTRIENNEIIAPTIFTASPLLDGDPPIWSGSGTIVLTNPEDAERVVIEQKRAGYDFIKIYNRLTPDVYHALLEAAKQNNIGTVGHIPRQVGAEEALKAGQTMIAHGEEFFFTYFGGPTDKLNQAKNRSKPDEGKIPAIARQTHKVGTAITPNLSFIEATKRQLENFDAVISDAEATFLTPDVLSMWRSSNPNNRRDLEQFKERERLKYPLVKALTKGFHDAGVLLLLGTDASAPGLFPGKSAHTELRELVNAGLTPFQALSTGTRNAGGFITANVKAATPFGTISVGQKADLILLEKNPLQDINAISKINGVMVRGRWMPQAELQRMRREN
jgi:imidazolonepropionase-like amidohydrolase